MKSTISPSIDILNPSNIERLFHLITNDNQLVSKFYSDLETKKYFVLKNKDLLNELQKEFVSEFVDEEETKKAINKVFTQFNYIIDPHTAVAFATLEKLKLNNHRVFEKNNNKIIISATADFGKFPDVVYNSVSNEKYEFDKLNYTNIELTELFEKLRNITDSNQPNFHPGIESLLHNHNKNRKIVEADYQVIIFKLKEYLEGLYMN